MFLGRQPAGRGKIGNPKPLIVCGHQRSGTTLLAALCSSHPDIALTFEFSNFMKLDMSYREYVSVLRKDWMKRRIISIRGHRGQFRKRIDSAIFLTRYLMELQRYRRQEISLSIVTDVLHRIFPSAPVVGDKKPTYVFHLDQLANIGELYRLVIYRDCRDVARSAIEKSQTSWRQKKIGQHLNTAEKVAESWVSAIETMERHAKKIHAIRYEELVTDPQLVFTALGNWLGVDPQGFRHNMIRDSSVGKHKKGLSDQEEREIIRIAGPTMERLGYL